VVVVWLSGSVAVSTRPKVEYVQFQVRVTMLLVPSFAGATIDFWVRLPEVS
jgi:hypothetical protein